MTPATMPNWASLRAHHPESLVAKFEALARQGGPLNLPLSELLGLPNVSKEEVERFADELIRLGWLERRERFLCASCAREIPQPLPEEECPHCHQAFVDSGEPVAEAVYVHEAPPLRIVDWVLALHGMNTPGAWQEKLSWLLALTYGHTVPVAIYKYGIVRPGVLFRHRHRQLSLQVAEQIRTMSSQAKSAGYKPEPDVIAHSFGTLLLVKALQGDSNLKVGRVILAGSILRPDLDWTPFLQSGQVEAVLNLYGTADLPVAVAQFFIPDSGPAGRKGFDTQGVLNVEAKDFGHSTVFEDTHLASVFESVWRPFLSTHDPHSLQLADLRKRWKPAPWLLRAGLGRIVVQLLLAGLVATLAGALSLGLLPFVRWVRALF